MKIIWTKQEDVLREQKALKQERITPERITALEKNEVFVFGTDSEGTHCMRASRFAVDNFGAIRGRAEGMQGHSYAIPTDLLEPQNIKPYIDRFISFAKHRPGWLFLVTQIGCGAAGFTPEEIAPLFVEALDVANICLPQQFWGCLRKHTDNK